MGIKLPGAIEASCFVSNEDQTIPLLHVAAREGCPEVLHLLIRYGAELDKLATYDELFSRFYRSGEWARNTALQVAIDRENLETVEILSRAGASHRVFEVQTPLPPDVVVPRMSLHLASLQQNYELVRWLIDNGYQTDVNALDESGMAPLAYWSIFGTQASVGDYLIRKGADPNLMVSDDCNLLLDACWHGRFDAALMLLHHGADTGNTSRLFTTHLRACCVRLNEPRRDRGGSVGGTVTKWPVIHKQDHIFCYLGLHLYQIQTWEYLRAAVVQKLLDAGADLEDVASKGDTVPLLLASQSCLAPVVSRIFGTGAVASVRDSLRGETALLKALGAKWIDSKSRLDTVACLLDKWCPVRLAPKGEESALHVIGKNQRHYRFGKDVWDDTLLRLLLDKGADCQGYSHDGTLAIHLFFTAGNYSACKMLIDRGACQKLANEELCIVFKHHYYYGPSPDSPEGKDRESMLEMLLEVYARNFIPGWSPFLQRRPMLKDDYLVTAVIETGCRECNPVGFSKFVWLAEELRAASTKYRNSRG